MRVAEYRDLIQALLRIATDWHACSSDSERQAWSVRAAGAHRELESAVCARATPRDVELRELAQQKYRDLVGNLAQQRPHDAVSMTTSSSSGRATRAGTTRAAGYNKSPARAVRLSRAARGAIRRDYF